MSPYVLPKVLAALRKHNALSQSELAQKLGVTPSAVHQAENTAHPIKEELFSRYATAFGYVNELDALEQGVTLLRLEERAASEAQAAARRTAAPRKRAAKTAAPAPAKTPTKSPRKRLPRARKTPATLPHAST